MATRLEKVSFHSNPKERQCQRMLQLLHNALISHTSKVMLRFFQARLQQYVNCELPDVQTGLENAKEPEIKLTTPTGSLKRQERSRKTSISALLTLPKPLCGSQQTVENSSKDGNTRPPDLPLEKSVCSSGNNS